MRTRRVDSLPIRVLLAEEQEVIRAGFLHFFRHSEIEVVGEMTGKQSLLDSLPSAKPDILLMNVRLFQENICKTFRGKIFLYSIGSETAHQANTDHFHESHQTTKASTRVKVLAYPLTRSRLLQEIRDTVASKEPLRNPKSELTPRELQVLKRISQGLSNKEIAKQLKISLQTVKEHVCNILRKKSFSDRTQAAVWAVRNGLD